MSTIDSDMLVLLLASFPLLAEFGPPMVVCGLNKKYYNVNDICNELGESICKSLPFFNAFTGCDTVSSFFNHSKLQFWNVWMKYDDANLTRSISAT